MSDKESDQEKKSSEEKEVEEEEELEENNNENEEEEDEKESKEIIDINENKDDSEEAKEKKNSQKKDKKKNDNKNKINKTCNGIFINGIPYESTEDELRELFSPYGDIQLIKLPKYQDSGRNIGYAHIYYTKPESASKALELDNCTMGKRYLNVSLANKNSEQLNKSEKINPNDVPIDCMTAFIRNLPYETTEKEVGDKFRSCGKIKDIRFVYNSKNKKFKGFCYIDFKEHRSLIKALELNGKDFQGRKLQVDFEQKKPKKGFKYNYNNLDSKYNREEINMLNRKRKLKNNK